MDKKKVLVAGGCGFLGSWTIKTFMENGWDALSVDNLTEYETKRAGITRPREVPENTKVDITNWKPLWRVVEDFRPDYIINCAAQPAMTIALEDPTYDFEVNTLGTFNILEAARLLKVPVAICSSIHVYGNGSNIRKEQKSTDEKAPIMRGIVTPLHASKLAGEFYARAYTDSYSLKTAVFRYTGIYGPNQLGGMDHGWVANFAIRTLLERPITIFGPDTQARDVLYATDAAQAFLDWYNSGAPSGVYNIGGGNDCLISIKQCLDKLKEITGKEQNIKREPPRKGDMWFFCCNIDKAKREFGWIPKVRPNEGLEKLVEWIERNKFLFEDSK